MDFIAIKTANGLKPAFDDDYEQYSKLKIGDSFKIKVTKIRNLEFHKKYFSLISCVWSYQNEKTQTHFKDNIDLFRKTVEIVAGHCDTVYSIKLKEWVDVPKSIAFDKMDEFEFQDLYDRVKDVMYSIFLKNIPVKDFEFNLLNY